MAIYTKHSQLITPSINLIGIDTHSIAIKVLITFKTLYKQGIYVIKKIDAFFGNEKIII